jgi:hypothetical protein
MTEEKIMKLVSGTIYFVRESDSKTSGHSDLVKIGLVEGERSPFDRLREHQTGNPRKLLFDESQFVRTDAVAFVESQLHNKYAKQRVSGEWFQFESESEIQEAVEAARIFAKQAAEINPLMVRADELYWQISEGHEIESAEESRKLGERYVRAESLSESLENLIAEVRRGMLAAAEEHGDEAIQEFFRFVEYTRAPSFSPTLLKEKYGQEMYDAYAYREPRWAPKFEVISDLVETDEYLAVATAIRTLEASVSKARESHDVFALNELDLEIRTLLAPQSWDLLVSEVRLKNLCGLHPGIMGVCQWVRTETFGNRKIDQGRLFDEKPDVFEASVAPGSKVSMKIRMPFKK